jgi:hypothetical protein
MVTARLFGDTNWAWMWEGNGWHHRIGWSPGPNQTPPMPVHAPTEGTILAMPVGRVPKSQAKCSKLASWSWTAVVSLT